MNDKVTVRAGAELATVYAAGGIAFCAFVAGIGWTTDETPSERIQGLAVAVRAAAYPELPVLTLAELLAG